MQFAIILLVILVLACVGASFITQGQDYDWYKAAYSERTASLIMALHLDDAFHSWWFLAISAFLCLNLLLCNVLHLPKLLKRIRNETTQPGEADASASGIADPAPVFERLHLHPVSKEIDGKPMLFAAKNKLGYWGAWVCHLGILLLIAGFALGQATKTEYTVYGVAGQSKMIGDTNLVLSIDNFRIGLREDDTVEQYTSEITVRDLSGSVGSDGQSAAVSVNNPATLYGMRFYQNSTGWAARVSVTENGEPLESEIVCVGEGLQMLDRPDLVVYFQAFYPDYVLDPQNGPMTKTGQLNHPAYLYLITYQDQPIGMNALEDGETIKVSPYEITFSDPQPYTLIQIKKDSFTWLALVGGLVTMIGLFLALYVQPMRAWAVRDEDGTWTVSGASKKRGKFFTDEFDRAVTGKTL